jgi:hypothetical protein
VRLAGLHRKLLLERGNIPLRSGADVSAMISVISNRGCVGFVIRRCHEFEGFDRDQKTLGLFGGEHDAIDAVLRHSENQETKNEF